MLRLLFVVFFVGISAHARADVIAVQDFDGGSPAWSFSSDPAAGTFTSNDDDWGILGSVGNGSNTITMTNNFWGVRDIENAQNPNGDFGTLTFDSIDVSGRTGITLSFDYAVHGWDGGDDLSYQVVLNGAAQSSVLLVDGMNGGGVSRSATETINIANGTNTVGLILRLQQDGGGDWGGIDNVRLSGLAAIPEPSTFGLFGAICSLACFHRRRTS